MIFQGIVEDRDDPLELGRVRVRIFGIHTEERTTTDTNQYIPTTDLPWAEAAFPISNANISGIGDFNVPLAGSNVWLFFKDTEQQYPVYFATSPKIEKVPDFTKGFTDPNLEYPDGNYTDESGVSKLAKGDNSEISKTAKTGVTAVAVTWSEPANPYAATYPNNRVISTKEHVIEIDDTGSAERIHIWHKSGSFIEFHPNGDVVEKVKGKRYLIIEASDDNVYISGNYNIKVDGNCNIEAGGNCNIEAAGVIQLDGGGGNVGGLITTKSYCPFTGNLHVDGSATVNATK
jgi:hypothetical protein